LLTIYKASAGSGKTYTLAYEYILDLLCVKDPNTGIVRLNLPKYAPSGAEITNRHRGILAITFTNKATAEMKRRIIKELDALSTIPEAGNNDATYAEKLCRLTGCTRHDLAEAAGTALRQLLNDYSNFNVSTIDSFFQRVLRTFARELDRQGDFAVEINDVYAINTAVGMMLDSFNYEENNLAELGRWLEKFIAAQINEGHKASFFNRDSPVHANLVELVANICKEKFKKYSRAMREYLADPDRPLHRLGKALAQRKAEILDRMEHEATQVLTAIADTDERGFNSIIMRLIRDNFATRTQPSPKDIFGAKALKAADGDGSAVIVKKYFKGTNAHIQAILSLMAQSVPLFSEYFLLVKIQASLNQLGLLANAWAFLDRFHAENNTILLSDTNDMLSRIIDGQEMPFIYERLGVELHHFLIDEFQDTSEMQWINLKPLITNSLSEKYDSLIIGDEKQSIYRFRNSEPSLLHHRVARDKDLASSCVIKGASLGENTNWRSSAHIVSFNNSLFSILASARGVPGFENVVQEISAPNRDFPGYVRFIPETNCPDNNPLEEMAQQIRRQHDQGGYRWKQIAVLAARNDELGAAISHLLEHHPDIPVLSDEAMYLRRSQSVRMIVSILKFIDNETRATEPTTDNGKKKYASAEDIAMMMSRYEYFRNIGLEPDAALQAAITGSTESGHAPVTDNLGTIDAHRSPSLVALVETIIAEMLTPVQRHQQSAYIAAFQDYVLEFCSKYNPSVHRFIQWWEESPKLTIPAGSDIDAVRFITVHKSKGLEFECVHIPFGSWPDVNAKSMQWIPARPCEELQQPLLPTIPPHMMPPAINITMDIECSLPCSPLYSLYKADEMARMTDTLNMTYVAYTRAVAELIVCYKPTHGIGKSLTPAFTSLSLDGLTITDGDLTYGSPTRLRDLHKVTSTDTTARPVHIGYDITVRHDISTLTSLDSALDTDIDDTETAGNTTTSADNYTSLQMMQRGVTLHDIMARIHTPADIDQAVDTVARRMSLGADDTRQLRDTVAQAFSAHPETMARWFAPGTRVLSEQPIYIPERDETRRPDRIVFYPDGSVDIIDYKFTSEILDSHASQVKTYVALLHQMGNSMVNGYLWYPLLDGAPIIKTSNLFS